MCYAIRLLACLSSLDDVELDHRKPEKGRGMIQTMRVTEDIFLPDAELRALLKLGPEDIILRVERKTGMFHLKGHVKDQGMDLHGTIITVYRGEKVHAL